MSKEQAGGVDMCTDQHFSMQCFFKTCNIKMSFKQNIYMLYSGVDGL